MPPGHVILFQLGGAVRRAGEDATAFGGRGAQYTLNINGICSEAADYEGQVSWARTFWEAMRPFATGVYMNFLGEEGEDRVRAAYGPARYARLVALKNTYDPTNFFRVNQNIRPAVQATERRIRPSAGAWDGFRERRPGR